MRLLKRFSKDPFNAVLLILLVIVALLSLGFVFSKRYPNLQLLTYLSVISFFSFGLLAIWISVIFIKRPLAFKERCHLIETYLGNVKTSRRFIKSLFSYTTQYITIFIFGLIPAIIATWLVYYLNVFGALLAIAGEVIFVIYRLKGKTHSFLGILILSAPLILLFLQREYYATSVGAGFIVGVLCVEGWISRKRDNKIKEKVTGTLSELVKSVWNICKIAHQQIYDKDTILNYQAFVISIALLVYFAGESIIKLLPPDLSSYSGMISGYIKDFKGAVPYLVCIAYCLLSFIPLFAHLVKPFILKREDKVLRLVFNLSVIILISFLLGPLFFCPVFFTLACLLLIGEYFIGTDLIIIVSFFTFPEWSARLYSSLFIVILFSIPKWFMKRWIPSSTIN